MRVPINYSGIYDATSLLTHMDGVSMTICICIAITPISGSAKGATSHTQDISGLTGYSGITFKTTTGVAASKMEEVSGTAASNLEIDVFLIAAGITEAEILSGKWNHATVDLFQLNYETPAMGQLLIKRGYLGQFRQMGQVLRAEIRGINQALTNQIGKLTQPECDANFGDARCGLDLVALGFVKTGTLTAVTSQIVFRDSGRSETGDYFQNGVITWNTGNNAGFAQEIDSWDATNKEFRLRRPTPFLPVIGDTYTAKRGCRKRFEEDCVAKFSNAINFRGFPHIAPPEAIARLPEN